MSKILKENGFTTKLKDDQFLRFADNSIMGVLIIQRGYLKYFNKKFQKIFGYSQEEISNWKKREFYKIVHHEDLQKLASQFKFEGTRTASVCFRGITKQGKIVPIENYVCKISYDNKSAYLSSYVILNNSTESIDNIAKENIKIEIELPDIFKKYFEYLELNFNIDKKEYLEGIIKEEINSRNDDLGLF